MTEAVIVQQVAVPEAAPGQARQADFRQPEAAYRPGTAVGVDFEAAYTQLSGGAPPGPASLWAYAAANRLLDALDKGPHRDNTIIVFWSDHGYHLGEKGHWHKRTLWERSTHVPMVIVAPEMMRLTKPGTRCSRPVNLLDLYPTLLAAAGVGGRVPTPRSAGGGV